MSPLDEGGTLLRLGPSARRRVAVVFADVFGEPQTIAMDVASFVDGYMQRVPLRAAVGLRAMVWAVTWLPLLFVGVPASVDELTPQVRQRYLTRWATSPIYWLREGFYLLKAIALMGWGGHPAVRERLQLGPMAAVRG